jgi:hypothetical protein
MASLLQTIADMGARLEELRQQITYMGQTHTQVQGRIPYSYRPVHAVPLQPAFSSSTYSQPAVFSSPPGFSQPLVAPHTSRTPRPSYSSHVTRPTRHNRSISAHSVSASTATASSPSTPYPTVPLSAVLQPQEVVTFQVILHKGEEGQPVYGTMEAVFDGAQLTITKSDYVPSMVSTISAKPGELLYRFIDGLKEAGHLKRTFTVAPWKLCSVVRDGSPVTLEVLRRRHLQNSASTL